MRSRTRRVIAFAVGIAASSSGIAQSDPPSANAIPGATELVFSRMRTVSSPCSASRVAWSPDSRHFSVLGSKRSVCLHEESDARLVREIPLPSGTFMGGLAYAPDGDRLYVGVDQVHEFRVNDGQELRTFGGIAIGNDKYVPIKQLALSPNGKELVVDYLPLANSQIHTPERLLTHDTLADKSPREIDLKGAGISTAIVFSSDGTNLYFAGSDQLVDSHGVRKVGALATRTLLRKVSLRTDEQQDIARDIHIMRPTALAISGADRFAFTGTNTGGISDDLDTSSGQWVHTVNADPIRMYSLADGSVVQTFSPVSGRVVSLMPSASGNTLISCQADVVSSRTITIWDIKRHTARYSIETPGSSRGPSICALSPDEKHLLYAIGSDIRIIDFE
ncbi:WD40 repeat domain-containing protein [Pandoraea sp. PE-S2R-1]|uniref:WD40 repeat domain-containing protein n=1 Tax=Pandoraea sp. PE-S2R-1 TaxID=1986994 RepID=UPI00148227EB|nr:WD40 repeat domain-containing protein [Pandoraea sp. PE-S2R-1]